MIATTKDKTQGIVTAMPFCNAAKDGYKPVKCRVQNKNYEVKIMKLALATIAILALGFAVGSICACNAGNIGFIRCLLQVAISVCVEWFALKNMEE